MKRIISIITASLALGLSSCSKYLDQVPDDVITTETIFKSKSNTDKFLANIYNTLPNEHTQRYTGTDRSGVWLAASDEAKYNWDFNNANLMNRSVWSKTDGFVATYWTEYYKAIRNASYFMQKIDGANPNEVNTSVKKQYKAEAKAIRALYYFFLVRIYGPVVMLGDNVVDLNAPVSDLQLSRSHIDSCINFIVKELDDAAADLLTDPNNAEYGRMTKGIAKAYKVEALMLAASPLWNGNQAYALFVNKNGKPLCNTTYDATKWDRAAKAAKEFLTTFVPTTYDLFKVTNADPFVAAYLSCRNVILTDWNKEWIFARSNSGSYMRYDRTPKHVGFPSAQQGGGAFGVTQTMVDAYFMKNGLPIDATGSLYEGTGFANFKAPFDVQDRSTFKPWTNREPRFYVGVTYNNSYWLYQDNNPTQIVTNLELSGNSGRSQSTSDVSPTGYIARKNCAANDNGRGALLLRLANIYLDYAEALNEYDPTNADILVYLNLIRERAGVPQFGTGANPLPVPVGQGEMREAIRRERRVELAFENVRYFDTRRWKIAEVTDNGSFYGMNMNANGANFYNRTLLETRVFKPERDYLFPIPNNQVLNNVNMVQNPGW
jgi:ankyrin repeat protein